MKRNQLFLEYVEKNLDYKNYLKEILMIDDKVFIIKNDNTLYDYIKYSDMISELKLYMNMFGFEEIYSCNDISDKKQLPDCTISYSGGTSYNYEYVIHH
jgi:hypothetical protein